MKRTRFARLAVLLCVAAMLVLQGCGGDSDDSAEQDLRAQVDMLMAERDAAVTAQAAAEAAQATAMTAQTAAEAAQATAEMERDTANTAKGAAEEATRVAQQAQMDAETAQMAAETAQMAVDAMLSQANVDLAAATAAQAAAETAQMAAETRATAAAAAQMAAETAKMVAEAAQATAETAATAAMTAQATAEAAATAAMAAQATAETERDKALEDLKAALESEGGKQDVIDEATRKENNARAKEITEGIGDFGVLDLGTDGVRGGENPDDFYKYVPPGEAPRDLGMANTAAKGLVITPVEKTLEFEEYEVDADMAPPAIDDWQATTMTRRNNDDDATQLIYSWTDIEEATTGTFGAVHGLTVPLTNNNIKLAASSEFPTALTGTAATQEYGDIDVDFVGTFAGVSGTFGCPANACQVIRMADGTLSVGTGSLIFTPDDTSDMVTVADSEYLYLGFWLHRPDNSGSAHPFAAFAGGADLYTVALDVNADGQIDPDGGDLILNKIGRARYEGSAAGKYVTRNLMAETSKIGIFTATAGLTVDFEAPVPDSGTERLPVNPGTVSGTISNFMEGDESLGNWRVTLMPADLTGIGSTVFDHDGDALAGGTPTITIPVTSFSAGTTARIGADDIASVGQWQAQFFGNKRTDGDPNAVAGRFDVTNDHATLSGAFGAYNTVDE